MDYEKAGFGVTSFALYRSGEKAPEKKKHGRHALELLSLLVVLALTLSLLRLGYQRYMRSAYPAEYNEYIFQYSQEYGFEPSLIYALIYTESGFNPDAVSSADAIGLMQITEDTFEWAQNRANVGEAIPANELFDPETNIHYGVYILSLLREEFSDEPTMLAAYNAGIGNVRRWLADSHYSEDGSTLIDIPFKETKDYVEKIPKAQKMYKALYNL